MPILEHTCRYAIYGMVIVLLGVLIGEVGKRNKEVSVEIATLSQPDPKPVGVVNAPPSTTQAAEFPDAIKEKPEPYRERLKRFEVFRSKVLLKEGEATEKQRLLAHMKTVQWIEAQLSTSPGSGKDALGDRMTMIDFLEEALAWKDNQIRRDIVDSVERTLKANNLQSGSKETRRMLAGDKIELFAVLSEQAPERAKTVLETTHDTQLSSIFQYAIKRLALQKLGEEAR